MLKGKKLDNHSILHKTFSLCAGQVVFEQSCQECCGFTENPYDALNQMLQALHVKTCDCTPPVLKDL